MQMLEIRFCGRDGCSCLNHLRYFAYFGVSTRLEKQTGNTADQLRNLLV